MEDLTVFSANSEVAMLSLAIVHPELIYSMDGVNPYMFSSVPHQLIWTTISTIIADGNIPDKNFVLDFLRTRGQLTLVGTDSYINYLCSQEFSPENLEQYKKQLIDNYKTRVLITATSNVSDKVLSGGDVDEFIGDLRTKLDNLQSEANVGFGEALGDYSDTAYNAIVKKTTNPGKVGFQTGIDDLDTFTGGLLPGDLWFIGGRPSMGKSAILLNSILRTAQKGTPVCLYSLEMNKQRIVERLIAIDAGIPIQDLRLGTLTQEQLDYVSDALKGFKSLPIYIDANFSPSLEYVLSSVRRLQKQKDVKIYYVDYLQLLSRREDDDTKEIGRITRSFKLLSGQLGIGGIVASQLNRGVEAREDKRPVMSDLRQSGNIEEDADMIAFLYRDEYYRKDSKYKGVLEYIVRKYRDGATGTLLFDMDLPTNRINSQK